METSIKLESFLKDMKKEMPKNDRGILELFYESQENFKDKNLPFEFIEEVSQRGDGSGYETFWIFKRKSDEKYFFYYSYDGRIEFDFLEETEKEVITKWDFERQY